MLLFLITETVFCLRKVAKKTAPPIFANHQQNAVVGNGLFWKGRGGKRGKEVKQKQSKTTTTIIILKKTRGKGQYTSKLNSRRHSSQLLGRDPTRNTDQTTKRVHTHYPRG